MRFIVLVPPADINDNNFLPQQVAICLYTTFLSTGSTSFNSLCNEAHHCYFFYWVTLFLFVHFWRWLHRGLPVYVFFSRLLSNLSLKSWLLRPNYNLILDYDFTFFFRFENTYGLAFYASHLFLKSDLYTQILKIPCTTKKYVSISI